MALAIAASAFGAAVDPSWPIFAPAAPDSTGAYAAGELQHYLRHIARVAPGDEAAFPILPLDQYRGGKGIALMDLSASRPPVAQVKTDLQVAGSFALVPADGGLLIVGHDPAGTLYGVYHFLESAGVRWFAPGTDGESVPVGARVELPPAVVVEQPKMSVRGFYAWEDRGSRDFYIWMARNRLNRWTLAEPDHAFLGKLGIGMDVGGSWYFDRFLNPNDEYPFDRGRDPYPADPKEFKGDVNHDGILTYFEAHPEWYGLVDGKRQTFEGMLGTNICTSNPSAVKELARKLLHELTAGEWHDAESLILGALDAGKWCQCDRCLALGSTTDRWLAFVHQLRQEMTAAGRQGVLSRRIRLEFYIYFDTLAPPTKPLAADFDYENNIGTFYPILRCYGHVLDDPYCTEYNTKNWAEITAWVRPDCLFKGRNFMAGEFYNMSGFKSLPVLHTRTMAHDIPLYYSIGVRGFHYMHTPTRLPGPKRLNNYLLARLLWNPQADTKAVLADYFERFYGEDAGAMSRLYDRLEYALSSVKQWKFDLNFGIQPKAGRAARAELFHEQHLRLTEQHPALNDGVDLEESVNALAECRRLMGAVLMKARDETMIRRLREDERNLRYAENTANLYYFVSQAVLAKRAGDTAAARRFYRASVPHAEGLKSEVLLVQTASAHANSPNGLEASRIAQAYVQLGKDLGISAKLEDR